MNYSICNPRFDGRNQQNWASFYKLLDQSGLRMLFDMITIGSENASWAEVLFKRARTANLLDIKSASPLYYQAAESYHLRSLDQFSAARQVATKLVMSSLIFGHQRC